MENVIAVILAAGEGKRMKSKSSKVVHKIYGKALVERVCEALDNASIKEKIIVVGHRADQVKECMGDKVMYAVQKVQKGTGHAVMQAVDCFKDNGGYVFVLCGDTPLITSQSIGNALEFHKSRQLGATVITADADNPAGYGRIVRDSEGEIIRIVEHRDASPEELCIKEINSGMYCFTTKELVDALSELKTDNDQGEYYITDTIKILLNKGFKVGAYKIDDAAEILGINDRVQLNEASKIIRKRTLEAHMRRGVTIIDPNATYIDDTVQIGMDTVIYPGTILEEGTAIGEDCIIGHNSRIIHSVIGNGTTVINSVVIGSSVGEGAQVGPFAYIRPESVIGDGVKVGDFVEIKKSVIGNKTKIPHLTYIGDAEVGSNTNIACGVVTVNYNGKEKNKTIIGNNAFVGCNVNLIAPVEICDNSYIAAGSTITESVPAYSLSIARSRQVNKEDWVHKRGIERKEKDEGNKDY